jgi:RHS repeat-associated protein
MWGERGILAGGPHNAIFVVWGLWGTGNHDNGNVRQIVNGKDGNRSQNFDYDSLNRISDAYTTGPNWGETYTIDPWGNLKNRNGVTGKTNYEPLSLTVLTSNRLSGFGYDASGNMTSNGSANYTYDAENQLLTAGGYTYSYDGDRNRVMKSNGSTGTIYWRGGSGETMDEANIADTQQEEYVFFGGKRIVRWDVPTGHRHYYFDDHLGSHSVMTDATGHCEQDIDFYPYGGIQTDHCPVISQPYKFTGKERDAESGLDMFGARYYGSSLGRFMTPDWAAKPTAVPYAHYGNPQSLNLYSYVQNNPTTVGDPDGHCAEVVSCTLEFGAGGSFFGPGGTIIGGLIGAGVGGAIVYFGGKAIINHIHNSDNSNAQSSPPPGTQTGTQAGTQPKDVYIDPNKYPASAGHVADAQANGKPDVLTVDRTGASGRRADATAGHATQPGTDRDEYPPAVTREGGAGASVQNIPSSDNRGSGASMGNQISDVPNGGQIRVIPQPPPPPPPKPQPQNN